MSVSEFELIRLIQQKCAGSNAGLLQGIGDDCAVIQKDQNSVYLISTDCLVEGVHFDLSYFSMQDLGFKSLAVNLSDIAAMGGVPRYVFVSLAVPKHVSQNDVVAFYEGVNELAPQHDVIVAGGDLSKSLQSFFVNITVVGESLTSKVKLRSTAQVGDDIYVSGELGLAALGLNALTTNRDVSRKYTEALKRPVPCVDLGQCLSKYEQVHAMLDVSDGWYQDLGHIMRLSKMVGLVHEKKLPHDSEYVATCKKLQIDPRQTLAGGEDYQLLFTATPSFWGVIENSQELANFELTRIGSVQAKLNASGPDKTLVQVLDEGGQSVNFEELVSGYDHFNLKG